MENILKNNWCTGCMLCATICQHQAISHMIDEEGFVYPVIDLKKCIMCGACKNICPINNEVKSNFPINTYVGTARKSEEVKNSTSGGVFYLLADMFLNNGGYVCGAIFDNNTLMVKHIITNNQADIKSMQNSKYIQSNILEAIPQIRDLCSKKIPVLFSGTPCQVAAIKRSCHAYNQYLFTTEIVCHGVPSPYMFSKYIKNNYFKYDIDKILFREKNIREGTSYKLIINYKNGKKKILPYYEEPFYNAFMNAQNLRESCYNCKFANKDRVGDITIGDCATQNQYWKIAKGRVLSDILINTEKGKYMWENVKELVDYEQLDYELESKANHQISKPCNRPTYRDIFYNDLNELQFRQLKGKYADKAISLRAKSIIKIFINKKIRYYMCLCKEKIQILLCEKENKE